MFGRCDVAFSRWEDGSDVELWERDGVSSVGVTPVNCEAELRVTGYMTGGIQGAKLDSRAKFGKETVAGATGSQNGFHIMVRRLTQGVVRMLRLCSGSAPACSPSAQVKAAVAHVRRLKRNQRKGKLILSLWVFSPDFRNL
jgi:hypothetical protein